MIRVLLVWGLFYQWAFAFTLISSTAEDNIWPNETVVFYYASSCDSYLTYLNTPMQTALDLWNSVPTSYLKLESGSGSGDSQISCSDLPSGILGQGAFRGNLSLDSPTLQTASEVSIASTIAHEIGHVLGLGHSESETALMYYAETGLRDSLRLTQDDMDGITYLYPRDELGGTGGIFGCATVSRVGQGGGGDGGANAAFCLSLVAMIWFFARIKFSESRYGLYPV